MEKNEVIIEEEKGLSLKDLIFLIKKNIILILIITFITTIAGYLYATKVKDTVYTASTTAIVVVDSSGSSSSSTTEYQNVLTAQHMLATVQDIIASNAVAKDVIKSDSCEKYGLTVGAIKGGLHVEILTKESLVLNISYSSTDPQLAKDVANQLLDSSIDKINEFEQYANRLRLLDVADDYNVSANDGSTLLIIVGFILGVVIALGIIVIKHLLDDTYNSKESFENTYDIDVLAMLPIITESENGGNK